MAFPQYTPEYAANLFTSKQEIERRLSYKGVYLFTDDTIAGEYERLPGTDPETTDTNTLNEIIQRVTSRIMEYLAPRFEAADVDHIPRIREIATDFACFELSRRRGNQALYADEYAEGLDTLERYREGSLYLNAKSRGPRVSVQTYVTDSRYTVNPVRVLRRASTNTVANQNLYRAYPFFWL